jgi:GSH-dependent disulfide-bond oxidoreductase
VKGVELEEFVHLSRWFHAIEQHPAVSRGNAVLADRQTPAAEIKMDAAAKELLYSSNTTARNGGA